MNDFISRQKAIDAWKEDFKGFVNSLDMTRDDYKGIMEYIDEVPSAQPDIDSAYTEGYTAAESKYREMWDEMQFSKESTTSDCISRQDAIDLIEGIETERLKGNIELIYAPAIKGLRALPTAQPERKKDIIQTFHDYQIEWLKSHYDLELEPQLEELIIRFLHDTANMYMLDTGMRTDATN